MPMRSERGLSLLDLLLFIVVMGVGLAGLILAYDTAVKSSADPMQRKQAIAIAESLLEEVTLMPFTTCDPDDPNADTGVGCTAMESIGPEAGESRYSATTPFDNVNDYHGFAMAGIRDLANQAIAGLSGYQAAVSVSPQALGPAAAAVGAGEALRITVSVTDPRGETFTLEGFRTRHAPTSF